MGVAADGQIAELLTRPGSLHSQDLPAAERRTSSPAAATPNRQTRPATHPGRASGPGPRRPSRRAAEPPGPGPSSGRRPPRGQTPIGRPAKTPQKAQEAPTKSRTTPNTRKALSAAPRPREPAKPAPSLADLWLAMSALSSVLTSVRSSHGLNDGVGDPGLLAAGLFAGKRSGPGCRRPRGPP